MNVEEENITDLDHGHDSNVKILVKNCINLDNNNAEVSEQELGTTRGVANIKKTPGFRLESFIQISYTTSLDRQLP